MSLHKSLQIKEFRHKKRNVLKKAERVKNLLNKGNKFEDIDIHHLPKEKIVRMKVIKAEKKKVETNLTQLVIGGLNVKE